MTQYATQPTASHFVNGRYLEDTSGAPIDVVYPATGKVIARLHEATPAVIEEAISSAAWRSFEGELVTGEMCHGRELAARRFVPVRV